MYERERERERERETEREHNMIKLIISVNRNMSECPLNPHEMITEIHISGIDIQSH